MATDSKLTTEDQLRTLALELVSQARKALSLSEDLWDLGYPKHAADLVNASERLANIAARVRRSADEAGGE